VATGDPTDRKRRLPMKDSRNLRPPASTKVCKSPRMNRIKTIRRTRAERRQDTADKTRANDAAGKCGPYDARIVVRCER